MATFTRIFWLLTLSAFLITANGCSTSRWIPINEELEREDSGLYQESGQSIDGYTLLDGAPTEYKGKVRLAAQDSLVFWEVKRVGGYSRGSKWVPGSRNHFPGPTFSLDEVDALKVVKGNSVGTTAVVILSVGAIAGVVALIAMGERMNNLFGSN